MDSLNPILFRTSLQDQSTVLKKDCCLIFELVIYVHQDRKTTELSCGWAKIDFEDLSKNTNGAKLEIFGGSPLTKVDIRKEDVLANRKGLQGLTKLFNQNVKSCITVKLQQANSLTADEKINLELMPSTCLVHKKLLHFVSGFRNQAAEKLLKQVGAGCIKQPEGDVAISVFPKIFDNPDILEIFAQVWETDVILKMKPEERKAVSLL